MNVSKNADLGNAWRVASMCLNMLGGIAIAVATYSFHDRQALERRLDAVEIGLAKRIANQFTVHDARRLEARVSDLTNKVANLPPREHMDEFYKVRSDVEKLKFIVGLEKSIGKSSRMNR